MWHVTGGLHFVYKHVHPFFRPRPIPPSQNATRAPLGVSCLRPTRQARHSPLGWPTDTKTATRHTPHTDTTTRRVDSSQKQNCASHTRRGRSPSTGQDYTCHCRLLGSRLEHNEAVALLDVLVDDHGGDDCEGEGEHHQRDPVHTREGMQYARRTSQRSDHRSGR